MPVTILSEHQKVQRLKQVILIRKDLKMRRGKEVAQGSHASMAFMTEKIREVLYHVQQVALLIKYHERTTC